MTTETSKESTISFDQLGLPQFLLETIADVGYEQPSPIQAQAIEPMVAGRDLLGLAQTGTGKTAAFALPILANLDTSIKAPQALILAPTRELALQVSEAFGTYSKKMAGFRVAPIYGGQDMHNQLRALKRGAQVVVGTPGRVMDHMRRGTLKLDSLKCFVLDEADEMLRVGFLEDIEWILEHLPAKHQMALFSATMPQEIARITGKYLDNPVTIKTKNQHRTVDSIDQSYVLVPGRRKMAALARLLEVEDFDGAIVFVRTRNATVELAQKLESHGFSCAAINGDLSQSQREFTINSLKNGNIDVLVATDVASRGIDVPRISLVVNYDIPFNSEAYVHRIGRTGRAGREGKALLLITPREKRMFKGIERSIGQKIVEKQFPTHTDLSENRTRQFQERLIEICSNGDLDEFKKIVVEVQAQQDDFDLETLAAGLLKLAQQDKPLSVPKDKILDNPIGEKSKTGNKRSKKEREKLQAGLDMEVYRLEVGRNDGASVRDILGAIANELDLDSDFIGSIRVDNDSSFVELPTGMPGDVLEKFRKVRIRGVKCKASRAASVKLNKSNKFSGKRRGGGGGGKPPHRSRDGRRDHKGRDNKQKRKKKGKFRD